MKSRKWTRPQQIFVALYVIAWLYITAVNIAHADEPTPKNLKNPVWVMVFWLHPLDGKDTVEISSMELGGEAGSPDICATLPMAEVLKPIEDASEKIGAGLVPVVVCGIAAPTQATKKPPVRSEPGHPDQPQGPSGAL
jgi:hypothetical protein